MFNLGRNRKYHVAFSNEAANALPFPLFSILECSEHYSPLRWTVHYFDIIGTPDGVGPWDRFDTCVTDEEYDSTVSFDELLAVSKQVADAFDVLILAQQHDTTIPTKVEDISIIRDSALVIDRFDGTTWQAFTDNRTIAENIASLFSDAELSELSKSDFRKFTFSR